MSGLYRIAIALLACIWCSTALAGRVRNGNDLALEYATANAALKEAVRDDAVGQLYFFRYLKITELARSETNGQERVRLRASEPSSDVAVSCTVTKLVSLARLKDQEIGLGNGVALTGRVLEIGTDPPEIKLDPVIVKHKDRLAPAVGKELLHEVNPSARYGTDTKSGKDEVLKRTTQYDN